MIRLAIYAWIIQLKGKILFSLTARAIIKQWERLMLLVYLHNYKSKLRIN